MKLKNFIYSLFWKPKPQLYEYEVKSIHLAEFGTVDFAYWQHPTSFHKTIEIEEIKALQQFLNPGDFCIDIGAHIGDTTIPMALAVGSQGCVLALEPNQYVFPTLKKMLLSIQVNTTSFHSWQPLAPMMKL